MFDLRLGDCIEILPTLPEASVDAVVCDPPYEIEFMARKWDGTGIAFQVATWQAVYRVLKPGGFLLAFGGTRTHHRMMVAIEDAGFEIRDCLQWLFGSGFPKSLDVSKAIDRMAGAEREVVGRYQPPNGTTWNLTREQERDEGEVFNVMPKRDLDITAPATDAARQWDGWGTALKPAYEPIVMARKPLSEATVAANVLRWGTGAINIDDSRIESADKLARPYNDANNLTYGNFARFGNPVEPSGRWPANVLLSHSDSCNGVCFTSDAWNRAIAHAPTVTRLLGFPGYCSSCLRLCDERVHSAIGDAQELVPSLHDALAAVGSDLRELTHNHARLSELLACSSDGAHQRDTAESKTASRTPRVSRHASLLGLFDHIDGTVQQEPTQYEPHENTHSSSTSEPCSGGIEYHSEHIAGVLRLLDQANTCLASGVPFTPIIPQLCSVAELDRQSGVLKNGGQNATSSAVVGMFGQRTPQIGGTKYAGDSGGASRFFYVAKASRRERNEGCEGLPEGPRPLGISQWEGQTNGSGNTMGLSKPQSNTHPCVKPVQLMRYLVKMVTPPGGTVLDPFMGSGSTGVAAVQEGFGFIGIEQSAEYLAIAQARIEAASAASRQLELPV